MVQSDSYAFKGRVQDNFYGRGRQLLLQGHALWPKQCWGDLLKAHGPDPFTNARTQHSGIHGRHGHHVEKGTI